MDLTVFAKRLKEARESFPMSQKSLAQAVGVTPATISAYEKSDGEKGKKPTLENAQNIASALGVSLDWLCGLSDNAFNEAKTIDVLKGIALFLTSFKNKTNYQDMGNYYEYYLTFWDNGIYEFIQEFNKIKNFIRDDEYPEYLKNGLKNALFEKYKNYVIKDNHLLAPHLVNKVIDEDDDDYPF